MTPGSSGSIRLTAPAEPAVIPQLRHRAAGLAADAGAAPQTVADVALAVTEAVTNVVQHAYEPSECGEVEFSADLDGAWLEFTVGDRGRGWGVRTEGGLGMGLAIIAGVCDALRINQGDPGIEVRMRFRLDRGPGRAGRTDD